MSDPNPIRIVRVTHADLPKFEAFLRNDAIQAEPSNPGTPLRFVAGLHESLSSFDFLSSDSHWLLAAEIDGQYVGYLSAVRIHKVDGRIAVLFVDELMVLRQYRRRGVASALLLEAQAIAREIGAWRIRLCVEPDNQTARELYRKVGLEEIPILLCQQDLVT
jgi:ribosomal protein S18 acetylase RimI-like enzyme